MNNTIKLKKQIRNWILLFASLLLLSGLTAFPLLWELKTLADMSSYLPKEISFWFEKVYISLSDTYSKYPFIAYGTDWLAFAHIVIATAFIGPLKDPIRNIWVIEFGMIACIMVFPLALIAGAIREIPFLWRMIDCSFGIFGIIPLGIARNKIVQLQKLTSK